jgi:WD40 repeat protein
MGVVLLAFDPALQRLVALKVLAPQLATLPDSRRRFAREGRAIAAVRHENIVAVHAVDEAAGLPFLVMEYVHGTSLQERVNAGGPLPPDEVLEVGLQVARGLAAAHERGLVHRDVKPANILLEAPSPPTPLSSGERGARQDPSPLGGEGLGVREECVRVKLTDFGLARAVDESGVTQSGVVSGTPLYMAPEQARDEAQDHRADLFSLGSVLYALCTGRAPFQAGSTPAVLRRICEEEPPAVRAVNPAVPEWLAALIAVLHSKDPARRPASAAEVARLLEGYRAHRHQPGRVHEPALPARGRGAGSRRRALAAVAVVLAAVGAFFAFRPAPPRPGGAPPDRPVPRLLQLRGSLKLPDPFRCVAFNPAGDLLAAGCDDHTIRIYDTDTHQVRFVLRGHARCVWSVAFSPDGRTLASAAGDGERPEGVGELKLWDVQAGREVRSYEGADALLFSVAFAPDGETLAAAGWDRAVRVWDVGERRPKAVLRGHTAPVRGLAYAPDGRTLASAGFDGAVRLWEARAGTCLAVLTAEPCRLHAVAFRPDGRVLAAAESTGAWQTATPAGGVQAGPGRVRLWDVGARAVRAVLGPHRGAVLALAFTPDNQSLLAVGGHDDHFGEAAVWDVSSGRKRLALPGHGSCVRAVAVSPDGRLLASAGGVSKSGGQINVWEVVPLTPGVAHAPRGIGREGAAPPENTHLW